MKVYALPIMIISGVLLATLASAQVPLLDSLFSQANKHRSAGHFDSAILVYTKCLQLAEQNKDSLKQGNALIGIGIAHDQGHKFETALEYYFKALAIYEKIQNQSKIGGTFKNIGNIYRELGNHREAINYLEQALAIQQKENDSARIGSVLNDIGSVHLSKKEYRQALTWFDTANNYYRKYLREDIKAYVLNNLGIAYAELKQYDTALKYYQEGLAIIKKIDDRYGIALIVGNIGDLYYRYADYTRALDYHLQSYAIARQIRSDELLLSIYQNLSKTYTKLGDHKNAHAWLSLRASLQDSVYTKESARNYADMEAKYQAEKKQAEILLLQQNNKLASVELEKQRRTKYFLIIISVLVLAIATTIFRIYTISRRSNKQLNTLNAKLAEANNSKTKLISIINHDLRSPVSSLFHSLQLGKNGSPPESNQQISIAAENLLESMEDLLLWTKSQMEHFALSMEEVHAGELLAEMIHLQEQFAASKGVSLQQELRVDFPFVTDINFLKVVLRNLVGNAIKFTPPGGTVVLSASEKEGVVEWVVKDNGPGIPEPALQQIFEWNSLRSDSSGLGLKLAKEFTEKLGGKLLVRSELNKGTIFSILLPALSLEPV